jgi:hypothetical protein
MAPWPGISSSQGLTSLHTLYERGYAKPCIGNLTNEKSSVSTSEFSNQHTNIACLVEIGTYNVRFYPLFSCGWVRPSSLGTSATTRTWPIVATRMTDDDERRAVGGVSGTEVHRENLHRFHFVHHKSHNIWPRLEPGPLRWEDSD